MEARCGATVCRSSRWEQATVRDFDAIGSRGVRAGYTNVLNVLDMDGIRCAPASSPYDPPRHAVVERDETRADEDFFDL